MLRCCSSCPALDHVGRFASVRKAFAGMVCGCNDRKHCVAGPDPPRTAGLSIIRPCQHKATQQPAQSGPSQNSCSQERVHVCVYSARWSSTEVNAFAVGGPGLAARKTLAIQRSGATGAGIDSSDSLATARRCRGQPGPL